MIKRTQVYHNILLLALLLCSTAMVSQKIVFDLSVGLNFSLPDEYTRSYTEEWYSSELLNDSTQIRTKREYIIENSQAYTPNIGYELSGLFTKRLSNRFSLKTGLGLNYGSYKVGSTALGYFGGIIKVDTVPINPITLFPGLPECDCYENSYSDVSADFDRRIHTEMINLMIPAEIGYDIIPDKLNIRAGVYMQTPLYAAEKREFIGIERTTMNDTTKCKYNRRSEKNAGTTGISNFQWGVSALISYEILPKVQLEIGARQHINDMYVKEEYQNFNNDNNSFKPLTFSTRLSYRLYNGIPEN